jgi:hypothetical protein
MSDSTAGNSYTLSQWQTEISLSQNFLTNQVGVPACELDTWRFPYLSFDDAGFQAFRSAGLLFDTSVSLGTTGGSRPAARRGSVRAARSPASMPGGR